VHHHAHLQDGRRVTAELVDQAITEELALAEIRLDAERYESYKHAAFLMRELVKAPHFQEFLTVPAYARVLAGERHS
jgi:malate synthase